MARIFKNLIVASSLFVAASAWAAKPAVELLNVVDGKKYDLNDSDGLQILFSYPEGSKYECSIKQGSAKWKNTVTKFSRCDVTRDDLAPFKAGEAEMSVRAFGKKGWSKPAKAKVEFTKDVVEDKATRAHRLTGEAIKRQVAEMSDRTRAEYKTKCGCEAPYVLDEASYPDPEQMTTVPETMRDFVYTFTAHCVAEPKFKADACSKLSKVVFTNGKPGGHAGVSYEGGVLTCTTKPDERPAGDQMLRAVNFGGGPRRLEPLKMPPWRTEIVGRRCSNTGVFCAPPP